MLKRQFYSRESWFDLNAELLESLLLDTKENKVILYPDMHVAMLETLWSYSRQFLTKKKIYCVKGVSPYFLYPLEMLAMMGFEVHEIDLTEALTEKDWLQKLDHTIMAVIYPMDSPFTGQYFMVDELRKNLADNNIFHIELNHQLHYKNGINNSQSPYQVQLFDFIGNGAISLLGRRAIHESIIAKGMDWSEFKIDSLTSSLSSLKENRTRVQEFEQDLSSELWTLPKETHRMFDRAIFALPNHAATAFIEFMIEKNKAFHELQTSSLLTWGGLKSMDWLLPLINDINIIRGLVVVPLSLIEDEQLSRQLKAAYSDFCKEVTA